MIGHDLAFSPSNSETRPIFVVGNSRSGTTMMGRLLGRQSSIFTFRELHFFEQLWKPESDPKPVSPGQSSQVVARLLAIQRHRYRKQGNPLDYASEAKEIVKDLSNSATPPQVFETFLKYEAGRHGKTIYCDPTPRNVYYLEEILALYPQAYVVNIVRDPRAVLLSQKNKWRRHSRDVSDKAPLRHTLRTWANYHPFTTSMMWRSGVQAGDRFAQHPRVLQVRFEDLVNAPEETLRSISAFVGVEFESEMLNVPRVGSSNKPDEPDRTGMDPSVIDRWKQGGLSATEIYICQQIAAQSMTRHGYVTQTTRPNPFALIYHGVTWGFKMGSSFLLNIDRARSILSAARKRLGR